MGATIVALVAGRAGLAGAQTPLPTADKLGSADSPQGLHGSDVGRRRSGRSVEALS